MTASPEAAAAAISRGACDHFTPMSAVSQGSLDVDLPPGSPPADTPLSENHISLVELFRLREARESNLTTCGEKMRLDRLEGRATEICGPTAQSHCVTTSRTTKTSAADVSQAGTQRNQARPKKPRINYKLIAEAAALDINDPKYSSSPQLARLRAAE